MTGTFLAARAPKIVKELEDLARAAGRAPGSARLLAVSKGQPMEAVEQALALGVSDFGENYVQEWQAKAAAISAPVRWHYIGHLQSNKVRLVVGRVELIHSVDRLSLAEAISRQALQQGQKQRILIEINFAGESSKSGVAPNLAAELVSKATQLEGLHLAGLMVMPPATDHPEDSRPIFRRAQELFKQLKILARGQPWTELSMGTSQDYRIAVAEGATIVRLGTALFGERPAKGDPS